MKAFRTVIFWAHLIVAIPAALVIFIMSVTGVLLTYEKQMGAAAVKATYPIRSERKGASLEAIVQAAASAEGRKPSSVSVYADAERPVETSYGREKTLYIDPASLKVLGDEPPRLKGVFRTITDWHRWLGQAGDGREVGKKITSASNLAFLFLVVSGLYLWFPRNWSKKAVRNVTWFRKGLSGKARDFNWHNTLGFWLFLPLLVVVASGAVISYPWASGLVYRAFGEDPPPARRRSEPSRSEPISSGLDRAFASAVELNPDWKAVTITLPSTEGQPFSVQLDRGTGGQPQLRESIKIDSSSGEVIEREGYRDGTPARRARSFLRFAHTGEFGGLVGQTIAGIASLGAAVLAWTGISLAIRRLFAFIGRRRRKDLST